MRRKERSCSEAWSGSRVFNHPREEWDRGEGRQRRDSFCNVSNPELFLVNRPKEVVFAVLWISASLHIHTTTQSWYEEGELGEEKEEAWGRISCDVDLILLPPLLLLLLLLPLNLGLMLAVLYSTTTFPSYTYNEDWMWFMWPNSHVIS